MDTFHLILEEATTRQSAPSWWVSVLAITLTLLAILPYKFWLVTRNVITIVHEGGHALVAALCGRKLDGIKLHSDTSGVTVSSGRPDGLGMILTAYAGYVAPAVVGLGAAYALTQGLIGLTLWGTVTLLALMLLMIRNIFGAFSVFITGSLIFAVTWWGPQWLQTFAATFLVWFLVVSASKPVWELQLKRRVGAAPDSDADQLAMLTGIPGLFWVGTFFAVTVGCLGTTVYWMFF